MVKAGYGQPPAQSERMTEALLLARAKSGDSDAFSELAQALSPRLMRVALHVVKNPADAEEVVQDALWKAFRNLRRYGQESTLSTWLIRITVNQGITCLRRRRAELAFLDAAHPLKPQGFADLPSPDARTPEQICMSEEAERILREGMGLMPPAYKMVLLLREIDELSYQEIAEQLLVPVSTVKIRVHRARRQLRMLLSRELTAVRPLATGMRYLEKRERLVGYDCLA